MLDRLCGLETEYVARFVPDAAATLERTTTSTTERPTTLALLQRLVGELRRRMPVVDADLPKKGFFLATGGAVWLERPGEGLDYPLIEGATPECRGPRQLLAYSRAQDVLLSAAARDIAGAGGELTLCKSDCDAAGNVYGSQENYEVVIATGRRLRLWRVGVFVTVPFILLGWLTTIAAMLPLLVGLLVAWLLFEHWCWFAPPLRRRGVPLPADHAVRRFLLGPPGGDEPLRFMPAWLAKPLTLIEQIGFAPACVVLAAFGRLTAFRDVRRVLFPFLASRAVIAGAGRLDRAGRFQLAAKAHGMSRAFAIGLFRVRPVISLGPQLKALTLLSLVPGMRYRSPLLARQRLQINLGDGNLCEEAEYLRVGTTMLVLDAIEAGHPIPAPRLRRSMRALHAIAADATLATRVRTTDGRSLRGLDIQRIYLEACEAFVARHPMPPPQALDVLRRWRAALDDLDKLDDEPARLVGRLDWVTKRWLLETCGDGDDTAAADLPALRKKIDLRYHELSPDGYFERLRSAGVAKALLAPAELDAAISGAPTGTPAASRARLIRQFTEAGETVRGGWNAVTVGEPPKAKRVPCAGS